MHSKSTTYLTISLVLLLVLSGALMVISGKGKPAPIDRDYFKINETEKIDRVVLRAPDREVELTFENNRWRVNGKWDADPQMIKVLFATLRQAQVRRPVAASIRDSVVSALIARGVNVELSMAGEKMEKFVAGGNLDKTEAWFMKDGESVPFIMTIPGYRVYVSGVLELDEGGWRNKRVFDFNWRNFKSLTATLPGKPAQGFEVEMKNRFFGIKNLEADTAKLNTYLDDVSLLFCERFLNEASVPRSASLAIRIAVTDIAKRTYTLEIFLTDAGNVVYGKLNDVEWIVLRKDDALRLIHPRSYFIP